MFATRACLSQNAEIAQLVERLLPKQKAAGSSPVFRSTFHPVGFRLSEHGSVNRNRNGPPFISGGGGIMEVTQQKFSKQFNQRENSNRQNEGRTRLLVINERRTATANVLTHFLGKEKCLLCDYIGPRLGPTHHCSRPRLANPPTEADPVKRLWQRTGGVKQCSASPIWRGGRVDDCICLENKSPLTRAQGSNPCLSSIINFWPKRYFSANDTIYIM